MLINLLASLLPTRWTLRTTLPQRSLPPGCLTHAQLELLRRMAVQTYDYRLEDAARRAMGAVIGGRRCPVAMAYCVDRQAMNDHNVEVGRMVQSLAIQERREYQPWTATRVVEVVL